MSEMKQRSLAGLVVMAALALTAAITAPALGADAVPAAQTEDERLAAFFEEVFQRNLKNSPMFQSQLGIKGPDYGKWDDFSDAEAIRRNERTRTDLARLRAGFDYGELSETAQVSYRVFEYLQERALRNFDWRFHGYAFSTLFNPVTFPVTFLQNIHAIGDVSDAEAYISRLRSLEPVALQVIEGMDMAARRGIVPPSFSFDPALQDGRNVLSGAPFDDSGADSALLADFRSKIARLDIPEGERDRLLNEAVAALEGPFRNAVTALLDRIEGLRDKSPGPHGVWALPDGDEYYRNQIDFWTSEPGLTADEIHDIGLAEVARIRSEMESIMRTLDFEGGLAEFFEYLRTEPGNFYPNTDSGRQEYLDASKGFIDAVYADVGEYFNILPKAPLEVRRVEAWREKSAPHAFYQPPAPDGSRPGIYYVNVGDMAALQKHDMQTTAFHEGAPGHHFQIAIQRELTGVPSFRKFAFFGAYIEGWALYAERLAKEQGRFTDLLQDFGRLQGEMLRAVRLVVDTGAHARKWTREQMIEYMLANNPMTREQAVKEAERYLEAPGQALSYKIGMRKLLALRERAQAALDDQFDIREFHDVVLRNGAVPLSTLEALIDDYIAGKTTT